MSLAIFFLFLEKIFRGRCDSYESHRPLFWAIYFPTAPFLCFFFPFLSFLVWKDGKCIFPHLENCCAAGMGQVTGILFFGVEKALMGGAHQSLYQYLMFNISCLGLPDAQCYLMAVLMASSLELIVSISAKRAAMSTQPKVGRTGLPSELSMV